MSIALYGNWIVSKEDYGDVCPVFRKKFQVQKPVKEANISLTALGVYEAELNGNRLGKFVLAPGWTSYQKRVQYQEYSITDLLTQGENTIQITAGKGWCVGRMTWESKKAFWNDRISVMATIRIEYMDGTLETFITDKDWESARSAILFSEIYDGEWFDSNVVLTDWKPVCLYEHAKDVLIPQEGEDVVEYGSLKAVSLITTPAGETVIDFGQNLTGYVNFQICGQKGHTVHIYHAEVLDRDGNFYTANLRTAQQKITYICNGEPSEYKPHFTFQGFRYIKLENWPEEVSLERFTAIVVHSDLKRTGQFTCSDPLINKLYSNIIWGQKGNFLDVPTDCPQRDERLGWTGDAQVFIRTASYNFDVNRFFTKWLHDLKADQFEDGAVPAVIPNVLGRNGSASAAWGDAAVICPWQLYLTYGNKTVLREQFDSMKAWVDYIRAQGENEYLWNTGEHYADWLGMDAEPGSYKGATDEGLIATAYYAYSTGLLVKAGRVLGMDMDAYERLRENIAKAFRETYMENGKMICRTQTAHILALYFDLCENKQEIAADLAKLIEDNGTKLATGFVGTPYLLHALSDNGYEKLAYSLLLQQEFPSWLYSVNKGATTVWEHWDGLREDGTMWSTDMNSFNHYAYGAVADWMYGAMAGINPSEEQPGFSHIIFKPVLDKRLSFVKASIQTKHGLVSSAWRRENGKVVYEFEVPRGSTAEIFIGGQSYSVGTGQHRYRI